jgi:SAM-dependent methyltransferase
LGDARSVVNVGAGAGSYEPDDIEVVAVEPSEVMVTQRPPGSARVVRAKAEALPLGADEVDAAMAVLAVQHFDDVDRGIAEMVRVASRCVVLVTMDVDVLSRVWIMSEYVPEALAFHAQAFPSIDHLRELLPGASVSPFAVPRDFTDRFFAALWATPEAHLEPAVRAASSAWHQLPAEVVDRAVSRLRRDLESGDWDRRHGELRRLGELDVGLRLIRAEL